MAAHGWIGCVLTGVLMLEPAAAAAPAAPLVRALDGARASFILGSSGRAGTPGDRREPRRRYGVKSAVDAWADVEVVRDTTWLTHELEMYARRRGTCAGETATGCGHRRRVLDGHVVLALWRGHRAEIAWTSGAHAVRLGWRRIVETATGTMSVDDPPTELAAELLAAYPSDLAPTGVDAARWQEDEIDRLLYYAERALAGWPATGDIIDREAAWRLVHGNLAALQSRGVRLAEAEPDGKATSRAVLAHRLASLQAARHTARQCRATPPPWCAAEDGDLAGPFAAAAPSAQNGMSSSP